MRVLPTYYRGTEYRSRTEARWACFLFHAKIRSEYEPEGFDLESGDRYLPDFWLPDLGCFLEIKGAFPEYEAVQKAESLAAEAMRPVYLFHGSPDEDMETGIGLFPSSDGDRLFVDRDDGYGWCECDGCGEIGITHGGRMRRSHHECSEPRQKGLLHHAFAAARAERFDWRVPA